MELAYRMTRLEADGTRLLDVARRDLDARVPTCPEWTARDLVGHMTSVWTAFAVAAETLPSEPLPWGELPALTPDEALTRAVDRLASREPAAACWTWSADHTVGFFQRRAHLETLVHRIDAELAAGDRSPVAAADAVDGVDEFYTSLARRSGAPLPPGSLHLHCTDGDGEFMLEVSDGHIEVRREHAKGDAAVRGPGEDLLLLAWGRRGLDGLEVFGDVDIARSWATLAP